MPKNIDEELIKGALRIYEKMKGHFDWNEFDILVDALFEKIKKTPLGKLIDYEDFSYTLNELMISIEIKHPMIIKIKEISTDEIVRQLTLRLLTTKKFDYYLPVYLLYELPKNLSVGFSTVVAFQDLPENVRIHYNKIWEQSFERHKDFKTIAEAKKQKSESVFLHFSLRSNGKYKANKDAEKIAQDSLIILGFACFGANFNLIDFLYSVSDNQKVHAELEGRYELPSTSTVSSEKIIEQINTLTAIFVNPNPNQIELKIRNALRIYRLEQPVNDDPVKFLLLVTCFESLLMTESDRDYILWRLAEKVTYILSVNIKDVSMQEINSFIKEAYKKRSSFVHGSTKTNETITFSDTTRLDVFFYELVWTIINNFLKEGYTQIQKTTGKRSIDEYIDHKKFGANKS